jgi:tetratricopeptide (TPR) repeat protein
MQPIPSSAASLLVDSETTKGCGKMTLKVKTWLGIALLGMVLLLLGFVAIRYSSHQKTADALVDALLKGNPAHDDFLYISPRGFGSAAAETSLEPAEMLTLVERMMSEYPEHPWTRAHGEWTLAHIYRKLGHWDRARELFVRVAGSDNLHKDEAAAMAEALTAPFRPDELPSISGSVKLGPDSLRQVYVYLLPKDADSWYSRPFGHYPVTVPDEHGIYRFYDVPPGEYEIGVGMEAARVQGYVRAEEAEDYVRVIPGKTSEFDVHFVPQTRLLNPIGGATVRGGQITFEWEPYPGAAYYTIGLGELFFDENGTPTGSSSLLLEDQWTGTNARYKLDDLRRRYWGQIASSNGRGLSPGSVLGLVYPGGQFTWYVQVHDRNGRKISSSSSYYGASDRLPVFRWEDEPRLEGDRHVIRQEYEQAIAAYEKEGDHPDALRALAVIYLEGAGTDGARNPEKALEYMKRIRTPDEQDRALMRRLEQEAAD